MEDSRPRVLMLEGRSSGQRNIHEQLLAHCQLDCFERMEEALDAMRVHKYEVVVAAVGDFLPLERALVEQEANVVLNTVGEGVCVIDGTGACRWSNNRMRGFSPEVFEKVKTICRQAHAALAQHASTKTGGQPARSKKFSFQSEDGRYFELIASPAFDDAKQVRHVVAVVWDVTGAQRLQQKINAIDSAGRELTRLDTEVITKLAPNKRLDLLQDKIIRYSRDLMNFDHFAIRVLDDRTNRLEVVISEAMPRDALEVGLHAHPEDNGISGYVAATGRSYICHDTAKDPRYILGIDQSHSSLTVPLWLFDKVVGVFNIESQTVGAFTEDDRQFAEIFGRYVALALNMLELLVVERYTTSGQISSNVAQEVSEPLNDIVADAQTLMEEYIGDDMMRQRLNHIVENAQAIRESVKTFAAGPVAVLGQRAHLDREQPAASFEGKHVLIADDEEAIRTTIADILERHGCQCTVCKDGRDAISQLEQQRFDLVVSDIRMPNRNGYEIFAVANRIDEKLPVILMTGFGYDSNHSIVRASQEGLSGVMFKPFKVDQLLEQVSKGLGVPYEPPTQPGASVAAPTPRSG